MKMTRTLFAALAVVLLAAVVVTAGGGEKMAKLKAELNLTDAQVTQLEQKLADVQPLGERVTALKGELKALETAASPDQKAIEAKRGELGAAKKEYKEKHNGIFRSVLTSDQWAKYEEMQAQHAKSAKKY